MKTIVLLMLPLALLAADKKKTQTAKPAAAAAASAVAKPAVAKPAGPVTVPAEATLIASGVWRHTDANGKTWIYRQTPFGLSKVEELQVAPGAAVAAAPTVEVKVTDLGDSYKFEKPTPMGARTWTRAKAELSQEEKDWVAKNTKTAEK